MHPDRYIFVTPEGVPVLAGGIKCHLCDELVPLPLFFVGNAEESTARLMDAHFNRCEKYRELATEESMRVETEIFASLPICNRCGRYTKARIPASERLHRRCYDPACHCPCSYPKDDNE